MDLERTQLQTGHDLKRARDLSMQRLQPPTDVPGYVPERFLGEGAYGEVWVATEINTGRKVAIKFYTHRGGLDWSLLSREVEKLAFLFADRYVVQLVDVGWDSSPPYYVMEYIEQGSLEELLQQTGALPVEEAVNLFREIAIGLVHSHNKGVLHCDLKPANILLDQDQRPRLCDFGQSRLSHEQSPALGTLFYMAPEQADLKAIPDARWDVYALGALLYCMLTGAPPHRTPETVEQIEAEPSLEKRLATYQKIIENSPKPAGHRSVPGVDRHLADIIDRCLHARPGRRYENVQAVIEELNVRSRRRSRRPLVMLGLILPAMLLLILSYFAYSGFNTAVKEAESAVTDYALDSNFRTAMYVSEAVVGQIDRRWSVLREESDDPLMINAIRQINAGADDRPFRAPLKDWIAKVSARHSDLSSASWFVVDRKGVQQAIYPPAKPDGDGIIRDTVGRNWSHRDYFNGLGQDFQSGDLHEPITQPHLSIVFRSKLSNTRKVAFTIPIRDPDDESKVIGVLGMTVNLGKFLELQRNSSELQQTVVLVDSKKDSPDAAFQRNPRAGSILEHPQLSQGEPPADDSPDESDENVGDAFFLSEEQTKLLNRLINAPPGALSPELQAFQLQRDYRDPVLGADSGSWLAAIAPVVVSHDDGEFYRTGWAVIVQQRPAQAVEPLSPLRSKLLTQGVVAIVSVAVVLLITWGIVLSANGHGRGRFFRRFRKVSFGSGSGTGGMSPRTARKFGRTLARQSEGTDREPE